MSDTYIPRAKGKYQLATSVWFDLDNGAGTAIDDCVLRHSQVVSLKAARIVYVGATTGTVAGGSISIGSTVGGEEFVAATNYEDTTAVGATTALVLTDAAARVAAGTPILVQHLGVAGVQAGSAVVEIEYEVLP